MPVTKVPGGWRWGRRGKVFKTKAEAERQGRAAYASGYRGAGERNRRRAKKRGTRG